MKIPFKYLPAAWGLKGKSYAIAEAEYTLTGYELEMALLVINRDGMSSDEHDRALLDIQHKYHKLDDAEYKRALAGLIQDDGKRALVLLDLDHAKGMVTDLEYAKQSATLKGEPWVTVVGMDFSKGTSMEGSFELDWNQLFVDKLIAEGYNGPKPDNIVNAWFMEVCRTIAMEEFDGTGNFTGDSEANLEAVQRWNSQAIAAGQRVAS